MRLNQRLLMIANSVTIGNKVADIGTDHAYIPIYLVENKIADSIIASDIVEGPVLNAIKSVKKHGMEDNIKIIQASGLNGIENPVDTIIIAGMGGMLITEIIEENPAIAYNAKELILQPMKNSIELRKFLYENNFEIIEELIAKEGYKFYEIIKVKKGKMVILNDFEFEISKALRRNRDKNTKKFVENKIDVTKKILKKLKQESSQSQRIEEMELKLKKLLEVYECENKFEKCD
ncbi:MAG: tRNA (adenine(22)-N(1))-methyltransferase TrmK [Clostridiales bacterium]|nr:tRNA (adenine(22)-N(1))-methyltransferase TrmK [Clostridiales bacterium]